MHIGNVRVSNKVCDDPIKRDMEYKSNNTSNTFTSSTLQCCMPCVHTKEWSVYCIETGVYTV